MVRVKICGIRTLEDALLAIRAGADAIGLLVGQLHTSKDFLAPSVAREIVEAMPPFCATTLVTHLPTASEVAALIDQVPVSTVQLHSDISPEDCRHLRDSYPRLKLVKLLHVHADASVETMRPYFDLVGALLLDSANAATGQIGGTGLTHDWRVSARIVAESPLPVVLAGGLRPDNVAVAVAQVRPYAVDVNSGVKNDLGFKDPEKLSRFLRAAKNFA